jgi:hypothetical protein
LWVMNLPPILNSLFNLDSWRTILPPAQDKMRLKEYERELRKANVIPC